MSKESTYEHIIKETITINFLSPVSSLWYEKFSQHLQKSGYREVESQQWINSFVLNVDERRASIAPAERALRQAFVRAGQIPATIKIELEGFRPYILTPKDLMRISSRYPYIERLTPTENCRITTNRNSLSHLILLKS